MLGPTAAEKRRCEGDFGQYAAKDGSFPLGAGVEIGYYDQIQQGIPTDKTVIDAFWDDDPTMTETQVRSALAVFLFRGDDVFKPVAALSGGERARLLLLKLMLSQANFLLLDEPTNHLDIVSREALENASINTRHAVDCYRMTVTDHKAADRIMIYSGRRNGIFAIMMTIWSAKRHVADESAPKAESRGNEYGKKRAEAC